MSDDPSPQPQPWPAAWRIILAAILDFFTAFFVIGYIVARFTGNLTEGGFSLTGGPALLFFALIALYFFAGIKLFGGTPWQRLLRATRRR
ncbi:MAG: hypothetical protein KDK12_05460 [Rhodobacteraceae bacterium]|nr:hypothetical protein [Paracoccaceae bacterium]